MPSDIIGARDIVAKVRSGELPLEALDEALEKMHRDKPIRFARIKHNSVSAEIRDAVRRDYADPRYEFLSREDMARRHNIGSGRVTEIEQGKYDGL